MEIALKILQLLLFIVVSIFFVPMVIIVNAGISAYEDWWGNIMKF